jgi:hypothetical protein
MKPACFFQQPCSWTQIEMVCMPNMISASTSVSNSRW